jgi:hypothetical protein
MPANYITLTRQELYDMVWSEPMTSLAKNFGISDVPLAKRRTPWRDAATLMARWPLCTIWLILHCLQSEVGPARL